MSFGNISTAVFHDPSKRSSLKWQKGKNKLPRGLREVEPQKTVSQEKEKKNTHWQMPVSICVASASTVVLVQPGFFGVLVR
jgi:hypothetical protein